MMARSHIANNHMVNMCMSESATPVVLHYHCMLHLHTLRLAGRGREARAEANFGSYATFGMQGQTDVLHAKVVTPMDAIFNK